MMHAKRVRRFLMQIAPAADRQQLRNNASLLQIKKTYVETDDTNSQAKSVLATRHQPQPQKKLGSDR